MNIVGRQDTRKHGKIVKNVNSVFLKVVSLVVIFDD